MTAEKTLANTISTGDLVQIPVSSLEFREGGTTLWVHGHKGFTVLRIKCKSIKLDNACTNLSAHADLVVDKVLDFCLPAEEPDVQPTVEHRVIHYLLKKYQHLDQSDLVDATALLLSNVDELDYVLTADRAAETHTN